MKIYFRNEGEIKAFLGKGKLRGVFASRPALEEGLKKIPHVKRK